MDEEADRIYYDRLATDCDGGRVLEWEIGLPSSGDLTPLSQPLLPPELASAFSITPEPSRTILDVHRASQTTMSSLRRHNSSSSSSTLKSLSPFSSDDPGVLESEDREDESRVRRSDVVNSADDQSARALKRPRLVWTPQLHKRFVDVVAHFGIKNVVPKTIMQLMNVEGLSRENVASHLQKYRLYVSRVDGLPNEGPSSSNPPYPAQPPLPQQPVTLPYDVPTMIPMPMFGMRMVPVSNGYEHSQLHHPFGGFGDQQIKDWANAIKFGTSVVSYPLRVTPIDK